MERALAYRRKYFLIAGGVGAAAIVFALLTRRTFESATEPDALTYLLMVMSAAATFFFAIYTFDGGRLKRQVDDAPRPRLVTDPKTETLGPRRMRFLDVLIPAEPPRSLDGVERSLATLAAAYIAQPILLGLVLFTLSGDVWRVLVFLPVSVAGALLYWRRITRALDELARSGLA